jgi:hypothetical protein
VIKLATHYEDELAELKRLTLDYAVKHRCVRVLSETWAIGHLQVQCLVARRNTRAGPVLFRYWVADGRQLGENDLKGKLRDYFAGKVSPRS